MEIARYNRLIPWLYRLDARPRIIRSSNGSKESDCEPEAPIFTSIKQEPGGGNGKGNGHSLEELSDLTVVFQAPQPVEEEV